MVYDRYYYSRLTKFEKEQYKTIYHGLSAFNKVINLPGQAYNHIPQVIEAINYDNPHLFYVDFSHNQWSGDLFGTHFIPTYFMQKAETAKTKKQLETSLKQIICQVTGTTDFERELSLHDLLASTLKYDLSALTAPDRDQMWSHTVLGPLLRQTGVCDGIAKTAKWLLNLLNIMCVFACGDSDMPQDRNSNQDTGHAWNVVKIGGVPYHLDLTWDITLSDKKHIRHDYFNLSDIAIKQDHRWKDRLPTCSVAGQDYYSVKHLIVQRKSDLRRILLSSLRAHKKSVSVRVINPIWSSIGALTKDAMAILAQEKKLFIAIKYSENPSQSVVWLCWR